MKTATCFLALNTARANGMPLGVPLPRQERWIVPSALCSPKSFIVVGAGSCSTGC